MEVHIINYNEAGTELKKQSFIHYYHFILFYNQINAKVLQSTQRAKDERVRNAAPASRGPRVPGSVTNASLNCP